MDKAPKILKIAVTKPYPSENVYRPREILLLKTQEEAEGHLQLPRIQTWMSEDQFVPLVIHYLEQMVGISKREFEAAIEQIQIHEALNYFVFTYHHNSFARFKNYGLWKPISKISDKDVVYGEFFDIKQIRQQLRTRN